MTKKISVLALLMIFAVAFSMAATSTINLSKGTFDLVFENIGDIEQISFEKGDQMIVKNSGGVKVARSGKKITITGSGSSTVITEIVFPEKRKFVTKNDDDVITFSDTEVKVESDGGTSIIEKTSKGLYLRDEDNVIKISGKEISVDSGDNKVRLSDKGIIITDEGNEINLGIIGKLISKFTKSIVIKTVNKNLENTDILVGSLNDIINDRNINMNYKFIGTGDQSAVSPEIAEYVYDSVDTIDMDLVSSDIVFLKSDDGKTHLKIVKKHVPEKGYKIKIDQSGRTLSVSEEITKSVIRLSVKFFLYVPEMREIKLHTTSGDVLLKAVQSGRTIFSSTSGGITVFDLKGADMNIQTTSGDFFLKDIVLKDDIQSSSVSGDGKIMTLKAADVVAHSTSGDLKGEDISAKTIIITTVSGDMLFAGLKTGEMTFKSTSGDLKADDSEIDSFSGSSVSGDAFFSNSKVNTRKFSSVSGSMEVSVASKTAVKAG